MGKIEIVLNQRPFRPDEIDFGYNSSSVFRTDRFPGQTSQGYSSTWWKVDPRKTTEFYIKQLAEFCASVSHMPSQQNGRKLGMHATLPGVTEPVGAPLPEPKDLELAIQAPQFQGYSLLRVNTQQGGFGFERNAAYMDMPSSSWTPETGNMGAISHLDISKQLAKLIISTSPVNNLPMEEIRWLLKKAYTF